LSLEESRKQINELGDYAIVVEFVELDTSLE